MTSGLRNLGGLLLLCLPVLASGEAQWPTPDRATLFATPRPIGDFQLTDQDGRPRSFASLRGAPVLVFFGFTHCPDVCPTTLQRLKLLHERGKDLKSARVVMISVDGERDTPAVMKKYLAQLSPDFIGLTGNPTAVGDIANRFSAMAFKGQVGSDGSYSYLHSSQVFLVDKSGRLRASFSDATVEAMAAVTRAAINEKD